MKVEMQQTVELRQELTIELQQRMETIVDLNEQGKAIESAVEIEKAAIAPLIAETGSTKATIGGYKFAVVPTSGKMSEADLLAAGVSASQLAKAKGYAKVRAGKDSIRISRATDKEVTEQGA